jgi:hypothetical protein
MKFYNTLKAPLKETLYKEKACRFFDYAFKRSNK